MSRANRSRAAKLFGPGVGAFSWRRSNTHRLSRGHMPAERPGPFFKRVTKPLPLVEGVGLRALGRTRLNAGGCVKGSLDRRSSRILDFDVVYGTSQGRAAAWPKMLVSVDLRLLVLTRSDMDVVRGASWFVPVLRTSELHGGRTARRPTVFQDPVHSFFSCVLAPSCWLSRSEHTVCGAGHSRQDFLVTVPLGGVARKLLFAAEATRVQPRTQRAMSSNSMMFFFGTKNRSELVSSPRKEGAFSDMRVLQLEDSTTRAVSRSRMTPSVRRRCSLPPCGSLASSMWDPSWLGREKSGVLALRRGHDGTCI